MHFCVGSGNKTHFLKFCFGNLDFLRKGLQHRPLERDKGIEPEVREMSRRGRKNGDGNLIRMKVTDVKVKEREGVRVRECNREFV